MQVYRSSDTGAPTLTGQAGSLVQVLDAVLVTGYGAKSPAGWSKPFTGTNRAVFRQGEVRRAPRMYLDVNDNAPGAGGGREARLRGFEEMSAVGVGDGPFPTTAQLAAGIIPRKSATADATARGWMILADARTFILCTQPGDNVFAAGEWSVLYFGDYYSLRPGDLWRVCIVGRINENASGADVITLPSNSFTSGTSGSYGVRSVGGGSQSLGLPRLRSSAAGVGSNAISYPNPTDGAAYLSRDWIGENASSGSGLVALRGHLRGIWHWLHAVSAIANNDTFSGKTGGPLAGRTFQYLRVTQTGPSASAVVVETSDTWETN